MTKFSDFIRAPGTAGPPTRDGIRALGFALQSDFPVELEKYLWLGGSQSFTSGEKTQGRANLGVTIGADVQAFSTSLASLAGLTTVADRLAYTTAADTWAVTTLTAFARTILDDADAAAARATLILGNVDNTSDANKPISTATQTALDLKAPLASPAFTGAPTAPTAAPGTNTAQVATTAFVRAAIPLSGQSANITLTGVSQDITVPAGVTRVSLILVGLSSNGSSAFSVQLGGSGGIENSGYAGSAPAIVDAAAVSVALLSSGFSIRTSSAGRVVHGRMDLIKGSGDTWVAVGSFGVSNSAISLSVAGSKTLSNPLTTVRLTTGNGTDVLNAGTMIAIWG